MENYIIIGILACILGGVVFYLYRAKKRGQTCIGCPYAKQCGGGCNGSCGNQNHDGCNHEKQDTETAE